LSIFQGAQAVLYSSNLPLKAPKKNWNDLSNYQGSLALSMEIETVSPKLSLIFSIHIHTKRQYKNVWENSKATLVILFQFPFEILKFYSRNFKILKQLQLHAKFQLSSV
jgi:hypothetical protein